MRVLVTGASGFIGQHVMRALGEAGHDTIGLDIVGNALIYPADITKCIHPFPGLDAVIHLAAMANPRECDANPARAFTVNVNGTHQVLKMALESGAKKVVFASSAHVYGVGPKYLPTDEMHPLSLGNTYTTTKILGEELCRLFYENHGLSYTVLRLFNAYGPGQSLGYFIPDMIAKAKAGDICVGGHETTKDFVYIDDVARAFVLALETDFVGSINIGTGIQTQLGAIAQRIAHEMVVNFSCTTWPNCTRMQADRNRAANVLGWAPAINIWEGLGATIGAAEKVAV